VTIRTIADSPDRALEPIEVFPVNRSCLSHRPSFKRFKHFDQLCARWRSVSALTFIHTWFTMVTQNPGPGSVISTDRVRPSHDDAIKHTHKGCQVLGEQDIMNEEHVYHVAKNSLTQFEP